MIEEEISEGWYPDPEDYSGAWLRYWDGTDWSSAPPKLATAKERERMEWPAPPLPPEAQTLDQISEIVLDDVLLLGGHGYPLVSTARYRLDFGATEATVTGPGARDVEKVHIAYAELTNLSIGGAGTIREGGGFIGGGFGLEGFAIGAAVASVLNAATTKNRIETLIGVQAPEGELIFLCTTVEPRSLALQLSRVRGEVRRGAAEPAEGPENVATQLTKLADLVEKGLLERDEFDRLKADLLRSL